MATSPITSPLSNADQGPTGRALQDSLVDLIVLTLTAKQAHWNVTGSAFRSVHLQLDELVNLARTHTDELAERAATIGVSPDGRPQTVATDSGIAEFAPGWRTDADVVSAITEALGGLITRFRTRIDETGHTDQVSQDVLIAATAELEKTHWMWQAQLAT